MSVDIIRFCDVLPNKRPVWIITNQLIRSATSVGANIIEARSASSRLEFKRFYEIALRSANETKYWLKLLRAIAEEHKDRIDIFSEEITEIANMLGSGILKLKNKRF